MINKNIQSDKTQKPSRRRYIIIAGLFLLLIISELTVSFLRWEPKPDAESEKIIREIVAKELCRNPKTLTDEDLANVEKLLIHDTKLADIQLIEKFSNLRHLHLQNVALLENKNPKWKEILIKFGILKQDTKPDLGYKTKYIDLMPIKNLQQIHTIGIYSTQIPNIKPVTNIKNLKSLTLCNIEVSDFESIKFLTNLKVLIIKGCPNITDEQIEDLQNTLPELKIYR